MLRQTLVILLQGRTSFNTNMISGCFLSMQSSLPPKSLARPLTTQPLPPQKGWTPETRNLFHPGVLIAAMRLDYSGYSPHNNSIPLVELACHFLGEGREACQPDLRNDSVMNYYCTYLPKIHKIGLVLRHQYPELADFADSLQQRELKDIFNCETKRGLLIAEIEEKFKKTIEVHPASVFQEKMEIDEELAPPKQLGSP